MQPGRTVSLRGGGTASIRPNGQIRSINQNGMQINRGIYGGRTIVSTRNNVTIVNTGVRGGYVQRSYVTRGGYSYYSRTYYSHGVYQTGVYRGFYWGGRPYFGYYHPFWFHPAFYGWAYRPWGAPVYWGVGAWGWGGAPWFGFYGGYWNPYPVYPSAAYWLTDYLIAANLQEAYAAQAAASASAGDGAMQDEAPSNYQGANNPAPAGGTSGQVELSPEVKQAIADEVQSQIAASQSQPPQSAPSNGPDAGPAAANPQQLPPALDPAHRTFIVDTEVDVVPNGQECALTQGDVLTRLGDTPDQDNKVSVSIASSKKNDCAAGQNVLVTVDDLQEMHNHFEQQLDAGMKELSTKQGTEGMPKAPDTAIVESDIPAPQPDQSAGKALEDQEKAADQTETEVKQEAGSPGGGAQ